MIIHINITSDTTDCKTPKQDDANDCTQTGLNKQHTKHDLKLALRPYRRANLEAMIPEKRAEMYRDETTNCKTWLLYEQYAAFTGLGLTWKPPSSLASYTLLKNLYWKASMEVTPPTQTAATVRNVYSKSTLFRTTDWMHERRSANMYTTTLIHRYNRCYHKGPGCSADSVPR